jgi:tetratricopeptide (TPR) repeat protein
MKPSKLLAFFCLGIFINFETLGEPADSLVRWSEIKFTSAFERTTFQNFLKEDKKDYLKLFLANSPTSDDDVKRFEDKIAATIEQVNASGALKKKNDKKVKVIYQLIHERFLSKYESENRFHEIIKTGKYNCVTATALYALFFERLGIPYSIKEEPTHVYLVAYPNSENVMIETTTPLSGFLSFNADFKSNYVNTLKKQKVIGSSEVTGSNVDELFNKYYFGNENISLTQLAGIHFQNDALFKRDHDDLTGAYEQIQKGYLYYPSTRSEYLLMSFTAENLQSITEPLQKASFIGKIARFKDTGITPDMIKGEFSNLTVLVLSKNNDKEMYRKCYEETVRNMSDPELRQEIHYIFNYENGRVFYNQGNYARAKPYFAKAMDLQPNNVDLGGVFVACLGQSLRNERNNTSVLDSLEAYKKRFPSLKENNNFNAMMSLTYVIEFGNSFQKGDIKRGEKYQGLFEKEYESDNTLLSADAVGRAYSEASVYYFKKGQKVKANQLLDKGLQIVPDDFQLKARKQMINGG